VIDMARVRIAWRPVPALSPAIAQDAHVLIGDTEFEVSVRPGKRRSLVCTVNNDAIVARGSTMQECKRAVESIAHNRGTLVQ
jgi:hypothetical protein